MVFQPFIDTLRAWYLVAVGCGLSVCFWHLLLLLLCVDVFNSPHPPTGISYAPTHHTRFLR